MKQGRNDQCNCGSGKKYKKCCMLEQEKDRISNTPLRNKTSEYFFDKYNTTDLLQSIAGLSIMPNNHGKNFRFEQILAKAIQHFNINPEMASMEELRDFLTAEYPSNYMEDDPFNPFTDLVTFDGGDYLIFPGISESTTFILSTLLKAVFHFSKGALPDEFMANAYQAAMFILEISRHIADTLGYERYKTGNVGKGPVVFPNPTEFDALRKAVVISRPEMYRLLQEHSIGKHILDSFLLSIDDPELADEMRETSPVVTKPIVNGQDKFVVVSPTSMSYALTEFIREEAKRLGCQKELNDIFHSFLWQDLQLKLKKLGFKYLSVNAALKILPASKRAIYQFDDNKLAFIRLEYPGRHSGEKTSEISSDELMENVLKLPEYKDFEFLEMPLISSIGEMFFSGIKASKFGQTLPLQASELDVLSGLKDVDAIDLYKFAIANEKASDQMMGMTSFLDKFKIYRENSDSFYFSDEATDIVPLIEPGYGVELFIESKLNSDRHSATLEVCGKMSLLEVVKKGSYAPIYFNQEDMAIGHLNLLVEGYHQAVWVSPISVAKDATVGLRKMFLEIGDAIAYWLWQVQEEVKVKLATLGKIPIEFKFDFNDPSKFENIDRDFERKPNLIAEFKIAVDNRTITVTVPHQINPYLYGADNEGERILVKSLLKGIDKLLVTNSQMGFTETEIDSIIEKCAPLGMKKKVFILDTADNLMLDPQNLTGYRLVQEYDISVVLDQIVPLLGLDCPSEGKLSTKEEKTNLTFKIVQKALLPLLRSKLALYDSSELIKALLSINEALINKRERARINTPTRIACFVSVEQHQEDLLEELNGLNRATIAVRCLIEHLAAEPYHGTKLINNTGIDELMAIMDQIISWGSVGDQIHFDLLDMDLGILASKRIGSDKGDIRAIFDPFHNVKAAENIKDAIDSFEMVFPQRVSAKGKPVPEALEKAFLKDYGITFTRICDYIEALVHIGFLQANAYASLPLEQLNTEINKYVDEFNSDEFKSAIDYLSLSARGKLETLPSKDYEFIDIMPWRFNRMLSLLRRPLVITVENGEQIVYWGPRHLLQCRIYLMDQCLSGRFRAFKKSEVVKVLGKFANERGDNLVKAVVTAIDPSDLIIDTDVYIRPGGAFNHTEDIGDVDVLIIDIANKIVYSLECKSMSPSRNIKEMIEEVTKLFGENSSDKAWVEKHMDRHDWLVENLDAVGKKYRVDLTGFKVKSFFVTDEEMLTPHLRKQNLPLPFITLYNIQSEGVDLLKRNFDHQLKKK
jgi:hypothetical protein